MATAASSPQTHSTEQELVALEVCPTPLPVARIVCRDLAPYLALPPAPVILEPSAGPGAFVTAARACWPDCTVTAVEIRPNCASALRAAGAAAVHSRALEDFLALPAGLTLLRQADLVVGNPPFSLADLHIQLLLEHMRPGTLLAFLLPYNFLGSHERIAFWRNHPEDATAPLVPRPQFKLNKAGKKGSDSREYAMFIWRARAPTDPAPTPKRLPHIVWRHSTRALGRRRGPRGTPLAPNPQLELTTE